MLLCMNGLFIAPARAQNITLNILSGTTLTVAGGDLVLQTARLQCNGAFNAADASVVVSGSGSSSMGGTGTPLIQKLYLNTGSSDTLTLNTTVQVSDSLNFQNGIINLNGHQLQLIDGAILNGESEASHITGVTGGSVVASATGVSNPSQLNLGNLGAAITSGAALGNLTISRSQDPATNPGNSGEHGIQRTFLIQPQNDNSLNATLRFFYLDEELNGDNAGSLSLWKSLDGNSWTLAGATVNNPAGKYVELSGIASFSYWTLSDAADPLPLVLVSFQAICAGQYALIQWQTASESNLDYFGVQKSLDGVNWTSIAEVAATNDPNGSNYSYKDPNPQPSDYYRLAIVDHAGNISYSPVFKGGCGDISLPLTVYPNPASSQVTAQVSLRAAMTANLQVFNMAGQLVFSAQWNLQPGINQYVIPVTMLAAGSYAVRLSLGASTQQTIFFKH
jgi:hypothetical protein